MTSEFSLHHITPDFWNENSSTCQHFIDIESNWQMIPLLNYVVPENIKEMQLLRFYGMIQNMHNPEFFLSKYEVKNILTGKSVVVSGKHKDSVLCKEHEKFVEDSEYNENSERETWLCVPIPAQNDWVSSSWKKRHLKRHLPTLDEASGSARKLMKDNQESSNSSDGKAEDSLTISLPESNYRKCYLKLYDFDTTPYSLNDVVEVAGFVSLMQDINIEEGFTLDLNAPESKIPRLHVVTCKRMIPSLTFLPEISLGGFDSVRKDLHLVLSQLLLGDTVAAEYFLCHLLSSVYSRTDMMPLGQFPLNIIHIPKVDYVKNLYSILELIVEKSIFFPMTLQNLNDETFTPKKNYDNDELNEGLLQLSPHTHLVLDETRMEPGKLEVLGVHNMTALRKLVVEQKVAYDFQYYQLDFNCDIPVLVFSEGKSLLPCSFIIPMEPDGACLETVSEIFQATLHFLQPPVLDRMRAYVLSIQSATFTMEHEMQQRIEEDFVKMRQNKDFKTSAEDLHNLMVLSRLMSLSLGEESLSSKTWEHTLFLETTRKQRLAKANVSCS